MTTMISVNVVRNVVAPADADAYDLSAATRAVPIAGRPKKLIQRLTASLSHPMQDVIGGLLMDFIDTGVYDKLDFLGGQLTNAADSLLNWQTNGRVAANTGMTWAKATGFVGDGVAAWINPNWALGKYQLGNASFFAWVPPNTPLPTSTETRLVARGPGGGVTYTYINPGASLSAQVNGSCNRSSGAATNYSGARDGLWCVTDEAGTSRMRHKGGDVLAESTAGTQGLQTDIGICRNSNTYSNWRVGAFGYGASLTQADQQALRDFLDNLWAAMTA